MQIFTAYRYILKTIRALKIETSVVLYCDSSENEIV